MVPHHVFSQLILFARIWLVVIVHLTRPTRPVTAPATPTEESEPLTSERHRSKAPQPFEGLTHKPHCALCERDTASPQAPPPVPPDPGTRRTGAPVRSTPPGTFARMPVVTTADGLSLAIYGLTVIPVAALGVSSIVPLVKVTFWQRMAPSSMANKPRSTHRARLALPG